MSKSIFYERFNQEFGDITPKEWLNNKILDQILYIATNPTISVKELAELSGFDTVQQLQQFCKRFTNRTPTEILNERQPLI